MYNKFYTKKFQKSAKKIVASGAIKRGEIEKVIDILASGKSLEIKYRDHALQGEYLGYRECHIRPDVLLVYKIEKQILVLILANIGSHSELF